MVVKERNAAEHRATDRLSKAGAKAEEQMAFYLRRVFQEREDVLVFNDLRLVDENGDTAQIDHLVMHRRGFVLIESKSVTTEIRVNAREEWSRKWNGKWSGMASPVTQAKMQATLLKKLLNDNCEELRPKKLLGKFQFMYGGCPFDVLVAISDSGTIEREGDIPELLKADQVPDQVAGTIKRHKKAAFGLSLSDGMEKFSDEEMALMAYFLKSHHTPLTPAPADTEFVSEAPAVYSSPRADSSPGEVADAGAGSEIDATPKPPMEPTDAPIEHHCRHCKSSEVNVAYGHNYYLKCTSCNGNTPIDYTCAKCAKKAKIRKQRGQFFKKCRECGASALYHVNA